MIFIIYCYYQRKKEINKVSNFPFRSQNIAIHETLSLHYNDMIDQNNLLDKNFAKKNNIITNIANSNGTDDMSVIVSNSSNNIKTQQFSQEKQEQIRKAFYPKEFVFHCQI